MGYKNREFPLAFFLEIRTLSFEHENTLFWTHSLFLYFYNHIPASGDSLVDPDLLHYPFSSLIHTVFYQKSKSTNINTTRALIIFIYLSSNYYLHISFNMRFTSLFTAVFCAVLSSSPSLVKANTPLEDAIVQNSLSTNNGFDIAWASRPCVPFIFLSYLRNPPKLIEKQTLAFRQVSGQ